ncbi:Uma2 family endonuclease [uncultured Microscilla sp.]|uniref:Uma2 family endonuclease n=1 Tax=uncultured Microscilla sp. TaxID=432653 RepID=UPI00260CF24B|nr:Uma2 family endonuclease [uncultured Microscilla sp.]
MGQAEPLKTHYTYEEYLELEQTEGIRYEYYQGEVFAMAGSTKRHNRISRNTLFLFEQSLNAHCEVFIGDVKVEIDQHKHYVYPDVVVTCNADDVENDQEVSVKHPSLVIEVLSKSTQGYDKNEKQKAYMRLLSLEYYMLIEQNTCEIELYSRQKGLWSYAFYNEPNQIIALPKLDLSLKVSDIYKRVKFD